MLGCALQQRSRSIRNYRNQLYYEQKSMYRQLPSSLKTVLLRNGNKYSSFPLAHRVRLKKDNSSVKMLLYALKYDSQVGFIKKNLTNELNYMLPYAKTFLNKAVFHDFYT